jgi:hypothetical protein
MDYVIRKQFYIEPHQETARLVATLDAIVRTGTIAPEADDREGLYAERMPALDRGKLAARTQG